MNDFHQSSPATDAAHKLAFFAVLVTMLLAIHTLDGVVSDNEAYYEPEKQINTLMFFTTDKCAACEHAKPFVEKIAESGVADVLEIHNHRGQRKHPIARKYNVRAYPTFILYNNNQKKVLWRTASIEEVMEKLGV